MFFGETKDSMSIGVQRQKRELNRLDLRMDA
jgi:hypothetical protein